MLLRGGAALLVALGLTAGTASAGKFGHHHHHGHHHGRHFGGHHFGGHHFGGHHFGHHHRHFGHLHFGHHHHGHFSPFRYSSYNPYLYSYPRFSFSLGLGYSRPYYYSVPRTYYYYRPSYLYPISNPVGGTLSTNPELRTPTTPPAQAPLPREVPDPERTFPYDGGPANPVPIPKADPAPSGGVRPTVPLEGRTVSLPVPKTKFAYPAYGEKAAPTSFAQDRPTFTREAPAR